MTNETQTPSSAFQARAKEIYTAAGSTRLSADGRIIKCNITCITRDLAQFFRDF